MTDDNARVFIAGLLVMGLMSSLWVSILRGGNPELTSLLAGGLLSATSAAVAFLYGKRRNK